MEILYSLLKDFKIYEFVIESNSVLYIENPYSTQGKGIKIIADDLKLQLFNLYPKFYGKIKSAIVNRMKYNWYKKTRIDPINLYLISENGQERPKFKINILIDAPYINHLNVVFPVIQKLISKYNIYLLARWQDIKKYELKYTFCAVKFKKEHYKKLDKELNCYFPYLRRNSTHLFKYENFDIEKFLDDDLYSYHKKTLPAIEYEIKNFKTIVSTLNPAIIIVGDDRAPSSVRIDMLYSKKENIPFVEIQHGLYSPEKLMACPIADKIFIWGEAMKGALIGAGATEDQLEVTGSPLYDSLIDRFNEHSPNLNSTKTLLFATQPLPGDINIQIITEIASFLENNNAITLIVKPHPSENTSYYENSLRDFTNDHIIVKDSKDDFTDLLLDANVLITISSTVGIEAAILDKPMICVNLTGEKSVYVSNGVALEVKDLKELTTVIEKVLNDVNVIKKLSKCRKKFVHDYAYLKDGKASERIADAIVKMIESNN